MARLGEFERIDRYFRPLAAPGALGLGDDAALIDGPTGEQLVLTADAIVAGVHFFSDDPADLVARKLLRVNLSDLAAMGAAPVGYLLTTALPASCDEPWLEAFARGLAADQAEFGIGLLGGDSVASPGPATLSLTALGRVASGRAIRRNGARAGDVVFASGTLGDGALGLKVLKGELPALAPEHCRFLAGRYHLPQPRLALGGRLAGLAHAMIDVSDGLVADLGHICATSGVGARIAAPRLPLSPAAAAAIAAEPRLIAAALGGGDDYELVFTAPGAAAAALSDLAAALALGITAIGEIVPGEGVAVTDRDGQPVAVAAGGYRHF
jgi:thiamine-monophosphate kinase